MRTSDEQRVYDAKVEARQLGHTFFVEHVPGGEPTVAYVASAGGYSGSGQPVFAHALTHATSAGEAADAGIAALRAEVSAAT